MGGLDKVEKLMGDSADAIAYQKEVSDMLGGRISNQDEQEVEDELAALEAQMGGPEELPSVPNAQLPAAESEAQGQAAQKQPERQAMLAA